MGKIINWELCKRFYFTNSVVFALIKISYKMNHEMSRCLEVKLFTQIRPERSDLMVVNVIPCERIQVVINFAQKEGKNMTVWMIFIY